ncbi:MAG: methionine--tRNA ligase [Patescibacteria group bacterium]
MNKFYITTPIYYVNTAPHIGSAYPTVIADVLARYHKQLQQKTYFLTGTDEHGAKIAQAALSNNKTPQEYADIISIEFKKEWKLLNVDYSRFIRTTDTDHIETAKSFLQKLYNNGFIDPKPRLYEGLYCIGHEKFMLPDELVNGLCPDHNTKPVKQAEENYYFKLSHFQDQLIKLIKSNKLKIYPEIRRNEVLGRLQEKLEDISISRANVSWGIPLPFNSKHTAYVWIEALMNYYTFGKSLGIWPANIHIIGKDILWFHAIIWPAMLLAISEDVPQEILVHGFFTIDGKKMSKTLGNVIIPTDLVNKYGTDGARYLLLTALTFGDDGDISWKKFDEKYNSDLANGLGNLVARVSKLCETSGFKETASEKSVHMIDISDEYKKAMEEYRFNDALSLVFQKISKLDKYINEEKPWELLKVSTNHKGRELSAILGHAVDQIIEIALLLAPFMPKTSEKIKNQFTKQEIKSEASLFPRI